MILECVMSVKRAGQLTTPLILSRTQRRKSVMRVMTISKEADHKHEPDLYKITVTTKDGVEWTACKHCYTYFPESSYDWKEEVKKND
jgi:Pyruvate/2-oxoacid:ferredoxin oxidoreductase delta subunit